MSIKSEIARKARLLASKAGDEDISVSSQRAFVYTWLNTTKHLPESVIRETFQVILNS